MLELCFDQFTRGSLRMAQGCGGEMLLMGEGLVSRFVVMDEPRQECTPEEQEEARRDAEAWHRHREALRREAIPLGGQPEDVLTLSLGLDMGDIRDPLGEERRALLAGWYEDAEDAEKDWRQNREAAARLAACGAGVHIRIWADQTPDNACGLLYAASLLDKTGASVSMMPLPPWRVRSDSTVVIYQGWGEVSPEEFGHFLNLEQPLTPLVLRVMADRWRLLQAENAPLRAIVNGRVRSVGAYFYDDSIRRALPAGQKRIAQVIGEVLGRERLGVGDALLADRIRVLLDRGEYRMVQENREQFYRSIIERV